jgi:hypothetical protein
MDLHLITGVLTFQLPSNKHSDRSQFPSFSCKPPYINSSKLPPFAVKAKQIVFTNYKNSTLIQQITIPQLSLQISASNHSNFNTTLISMTNGRRLGTLKYYALAQPQINVSAPMTFPFSFILLCFILAFVFSAMNFFVVSCDGARLSPLGTPATNWPIVPAPDDR